MPHVDAVHAPPSRRSNLPLLLLLPFTLLLAVACSDPQCPENKVKIGTSCVSIAHPSSDGGEESVTGETPGEKEGGAPDSSKADSGEAKFDASPTTGDPAVEARDASAAQRPEADAATESPGAEPPSPDVSTQLPAAPVCGDGLLNGTELCDTAISIGAGHCDTAASCKKDKCVPKHLEGTGCSARCVVEPPIASCTNDNDCCPSGCNTSNDNDCSPSCGNSVIDSGETCEPGVGAGCPTSCAPKGCVSYALNGSAKNCNVACVESGAITSKIAGDSCCPAGLTFADDPDCPKPACVPSTEDCDGVDDDCDGQIDDNATCPALASECAVSTCVLGGCSSTPKPAGVLCAQGQCDGAGKCAYCGDGIVNGAEQCDPKKTGVGTFLCSPDCQSRRIYMSCLPDDPSQMYGPSKSCDQGAFCTAEKFCAPPAPSGQPDSCPALDGPYRQVVLQFLMPLCVIACTTASDCPLVVPKCQSLGLAAQPDAAGYCVP